MPTSHNSMTSECSRLTLEGTGPTSSTEKPDRAYGKTTDNFVDISGIKVRATSTPAVCIRVQNITLLGHILHTCAQILDAIKALTSIQLQLFSALVCMMNARTVQLILIRNVALMPLMSTQPRRESSVCSRGIYWYKHSTASWYIVIIVDILVAALRMHTRMLGISHQSPEDIIAAQLVPKLIIWVQTELINGSASF